MSLNKALDSRFKPLINVFPVFPFFFFFFALLPGAEIKAKRMEIIQEREGRVTHFSEGLRILDARTEIFAKSGFYFPNRNLFILLDSVVIRSEDGEIKSDSCIYFLSSQTSELFKNVELNFESLKIFTQRVLWDGEKKEAKSKEVLLILKEKDMELTGGDAIYNLSNKRGIIREKPVLLLKGEETTTVIGNNFLYDGLLRQLVFKVNVEIRQKNSSIFCDTLIYLLSGDSGIALGNPRLIGEKEEVKGNEFRFFAEEGEVRLMKVMGDVSVVYQTNREKVEIGGEEFIAKVAKGEVSVITMAGVTYGRVIIR
ncbi:MAG: OstA-like protein [candidate division WOR-3 bacterium]